MSQPDFLGFHRATVLSNAVSSRSQTCKRQPRRCRFVRLGSSLVFQIQVALVHIPGFLVGADIVTSRVTLVAIATFMAALRITPFSILCSTPLRDPCSYKGKPTIEPYSIFKGNPTIEPYSTLQGNPTIEPYNSAFTLNPKL